MSILNGSAIAFDASTTVTIYGSLVLQDSTVRVEEGTPLVIGGCIQSENSTIIIETQSTPTSQRIEIASGLSLDCDLSTVGVKVQTSNPNVVVCNEKLERFSIFLQIRS